MGRSYNNRIGFLVAEIRQATGAFQQRHQRRACRGIERSPARANLRMALALIGERRLCVASAANLQRDLVHTVRQRFRSEEHTSELQSLMRISYAVFCLKKNKKP